MGITKVNSPINSKRAERGHKASHVGKAASSPASKLPRARAKRKAGAVQRAAARASS